MIPEKSYAREGYIWQDSVAAWDLGPCGYRPGSGGRIDNTSYRTLNNSVSPPLSADGVPGYRKLIADGQSATSSRTIVVYNVQSSLAVHDAWGEWVNPSNHIYYCMGVPKPEPPLLSYWWQWFPVPPDTTRSVSADIRTQVDELAWSDVSQRIFSLTTDGMLGETAANIHKAIDLVRHPIKRCFAIQKSYTQRVKRRVRRFKAGLTPKERRILHQGRRAAVARLRDESPFTYRQLLDLERKLREDWLYYSFGVLNALQDARAIIHATNREIRRNPGSIRINVMRQAEQLYRWSDSANTRVRTYACQLEQTAVYQRSIKLGVRLPCNQLRDLDDPIARLGGSAQAFIPTLWAIVPGSWAVDYFIDVDGHILDWIARSATIVWGCTSAVEELSLLCKASPIPANFGEVKCRSEVLSDGLINRKAVTRSLVNLLPYKPWRLNLPVSAPQWANLWSVYAPKPNWSK